MTRNEQLRDIIASTQEENARLALVMAKRPKPLSLQEAHETEGMRQRIAINHDVIRQCQEQLLRQ